MSPRLPHKAPGGLIFTPARLILMLLILLNFIYSGLYANQRHLAFETGAFDLGVYAQPLWNFIQGRDFSVSLQADNGPLRWANHVEPILFLIVPLYKLWPDPRTLLWLQVAGLSLAGLPLFALAERRLQNEWVALVIVLAYFLMPTTQAVTLFDFHAVALAPLFLLSAIYFLDRALAAQGKSLWLWPEGNGEWRTHRADVLNDEGRRAKGEAVSVGQVGNLSYKGAYVLSALFFLLALSTKEDISLHVFMIGLYLLLLRRCWWEGGSLMMVGLAWFYVTFQVIIPAFRTAGGQSIFVAWFETLGSTPLEIALSPLTTPDKVLALIFRPGNIPALGMITVPLALLPLPGLPFSAMAAPSIAFSLLSQNPTTRQFETWHYAAPMLAFVMLGTIDGLARMSYYGSRVGGRGSGIRGQGSRITHHASRTTHHAFLTTFLAIILLMTALIYHHLRGYSPLSRLSEWPEITAHHRLGHELAATIPAEASVLAQAQLVPHVSHRYELRIWDGPLYTDYDYIWLDLSHPKFPNRFNAHGELLTGLIIEHGFGPVVARDGYLLLKKGAERVPISDELFTFTRFDQLPVEAQPFEAMFGDDLKLVGVKPEVRRLATSETEPQVILFFEVLQKPTADYQMFIYRLNQKGEIKGATDYPQPAIYWWPTSRWEAGDRHQVRVNTIPWWTGEQPVSVFGYALGFTRSDDPWDRSARLPVTLADESANPPGSQPVDNDTLLPIVAFRRLAGLSYPKPLTILQVAE